MEKSDTGKQLKFYSTRYILEGKRFCFFVIAEDLDHANEIIAARGLGESIIGELENNTLIHPAKSQLEALHLTCFQAFIAIKSGKVSVDEILGDTGIIHELIHTMLGDMDNIRLKLLNKRLQKLQAESILQYN